MDIAHDRAGFYICWGCLVLVPSVYTSPAMYLVCHPISLGLKLSLGILIAGIVCIFINYDCDRQWQLFRKTNGNCLIWGRPPSKIEASYETVSGEKHEKRFTYLSALHLKERYASYLMDLCYKKPESCWVALFVADKLYG